MRVAKTARCAMSRQRRFGPRIARTPPPWDDPFVPQAAAGLLMDKELEYLTKATTNRRPLHRHSRGRKVSGDQSHPESRSSWPLLIGGAMVTPQGQGGPPATRWSSGQGRSGQETPMSRATDVASGGPHRGRGEGRGDQRVEVIVKALGLDIGPGPLSLRG
jgi:hypothetical protein